MKMKSPLVYLTLVKLKNQAKNILKTPSKLIYCIFLVLMFGLMAFSGSVSDGDAPASYRSVSELAAIVTAFYTVMFLLVFVNGSSGNASMFTLSDVTMLFPSPISSKRILFYGLLRQMGLSLLLGFFLLFQYSWVHNLYGLGYGALVVIVVGYAITLFLTQLCAMAVYVRTSGKENSAKAIKYCSYGAAVLYVLSLAFACRNEISALLSGSRDTDSLLSAASSFLSTLPGVLFPVSGWAAGIVGGMLTGDTTTLAVCAVLTAALIVALVLLILTANTSYYEDVLETAETAHSAITAQKEGQYGEAAPKHVRLGRVGLAKGWGASAIYYKHKVENRRSGVFCLSTISLVFAVCTIVFSVFLRAMDDGEGGMLAGVFAMGAYLQIFSASLGRFNRELMKPYIYLLPEPPLKKLLYAIKENLISDCLEALLIFIPVGFILSASPVDIAFCIVARVSFALLFTAGNVLVERVFGTVSSKGLILFFYFTALLLMSIPGIAAGVVLMIFTEDALGMAGLFLGMAAINTVIALLVLYLCRNLLQYAELNNR